MSESVRADKWLWAVRFFKARGVAAEMCEAGKVRRGGHELKPATALRVGDVVELPFPEGPGTRVVRVSGLIERRVAAPEARLCYEETTDPSVFEEQRLWHEARRDAPRGRPTKKDRRDMGRIRGFWE
jgi:ribosome-associated heat shock protein Hsp15